MNIALLYFWIEMFIEDVGVYDTIKRTFSQNVETELTIIAWWLRTIYNNTTHCVVDVKKQLSKGVLQKRCS